MSYLIVLATGVALGAVYEKAILSWKKKAVKAAYAAKDALKE